MENYPKEKTLLDLTCEQQLAEIWNERSKIFTDYDKVSKYKKQIHNFFLKKISKLRFCNELSIPKTEKVKMNEEFYKKGTGILSYEEKSEVMNYFSQLSKINENDDTRKKKFLVEYAVFKLIKKFLNKQRSIVKQESLDDKKKISSVINRGSIKGNIVFTKIINIDKKNEEVSKGESEQTGENNERIKEKREHYKRFMEKLKEFKSEDPEKFQTLFKKFTKAKNKCEKNLEAVK